MVLGDIESLRENWDGCALFVAPDQPKELARAIQALIDDPQLRSNLSKAARERAKRFGVKEFGEAYLMAYRELTCHDLEFLGSPFVGQVSCS